MTDGTHDLSFTTGLPGLDQVLHGLIPGDNVVLQVGSLDEYKPFVTPFVRASVAAGAPLIYFRFARHEPLLSEADGAHVHELHPESGFEQFITAILDVIEQAGRGACYVFDSLSELAVDWYSDRMLGNFFMLACPYLYRFDTIAYFALMRNAHSQLATDAIVNTAQVVMCIYSNAADMYVQPLKVDRRRSPTMYMLHRRRGDAFEPVTGSAETAQVLSRTPHPWLNFMIHRPGVWMRTFMAATDAMEAAASGKESGADLDALFERLLRAAVTRDQRFIRLCRTYFSLEMLLEILQRMIGTGLIGGKSLGMLLARAIVRNDAPELSDKLEPHDSFFIGSDVFYTYLVQNDCWWLRRRRKGATLEQILDNADAARERMFEGTFPEDIRHQFMEMLNYYGQSPIIVRSSSLLEDNYGNAFSGKYDSVFCANQGGPDERLDEFIRAVRHVYASALSKDALTYRAERNLLERDEQMALLVQRVSGYACGEVFLPHLAGVGFSFNPYVWDASIDPNAGMLRMVLGLGTRAVDRTDDDYTRLIALNAPLKRPEGAADDARRYSQHRVDVLNLAENRLDTETTEQALQAIPEEHRGRFVVRDHELERLARRQYRRIAFPWTLNLDGVLNDSTIVADMQRLLKVLHAAYDNPVDIEFTVNFREDWRYLVNLVQCRPFQVNITVAGTVAQLPEQTPERTVVIESGGPVIGAGLAAVVDHIVYVAPSGYSRLSMQERYRVAHLIGRATRACNPNHDRTVMLIGPGRWGTRSPSLGVPVTFSEINASSILCEMAVMHEGLVPDLSLGTHFFNDLVEMDMMYLALFPEKPGNAIRSDLLDGAPNRLATLLPDAEDLASVVRVIDATQIVAGETLFIRADPVKQRAVCFTAGER